MRPTLPIRATRAAVLVVLAAAVLAGCGSEQPAEADRAPGTTTQATTATTTPEQPTSVRLRAVVRGLDSPVQTVPLPGGDRLLVVEQVGRVRLVRNGTLRDRPVLDISGRVRSGGERGLLSLALHPREAGLVYLHLSDSNGDTRVEEHRFDGARITPEPERVLLRVAQPFSNHNGGSLAFGADGLLYLGLGDGGSAYDPQGNGQDLDSRLGKLLRIDVDRAGARWEVAAYGLRNPWRFSFDPQTGDAWIGDVGQNRWEEVDVLPAGAGLLNFGWDVREGREAAERGDPDDLNGAGTLTGPVAVYGHDEGCSITGGVVVRDGPVTRLRDRYVYGDYCSGTIWTVPADGATRRPRQEPIAVEQLASIDQDADGAVYLTSQRGTVFRVVPA